MLAISKLKNPRARPVMMAPIMLVAAKVMPRRTSDATIVPAMPVKMPGSTEHTQAPSYPPQAEPARRITAGYTTAIPKRTHQKAAVGAITAK